MAVTLRGLLAGWIFFLLLLQSNDNPHTRCDYEAAPLCIPFSFSSFSFSSFSQSSSFSPSRSCLRRCRFVDWFGCGGCGTSWFGFGSGPWMVSAQRADGLFSTDMLCIGLGCDWIRCADSSDCPPLHVCSALGAHTAAEGFLGGGGLGVKRLVQQQSRQAGGLIGNSPAYLRGAVLGSWQGLLADSSNLKQEHNPFMYFINKNVCKPSGMLSGGSDPLLQPAKVGTFLATGLTPVYTAQGLPYGPGSEGNFASSSNAQTKN
eukprot:GHVT01024552.1.p1 GENE.GHVT01024552.1~~GHVT01024552.1.p1  ORF type:complete len:261 (-),score=56.26 GHVT01024552.1:552-1334(-)